MSLFPTGVYERANGRCPSVITVMTIPSSNSPDEKQATEYLAALEDGCGCVEIWEHLSERREIGEHSDEDGTEATVEQ